MARLLTAMMPTGSLRERSCLDLLNDSFEVMMVDRDAYVWLLVRQ